MSWPLVLVAGFVAIGLWPAHARFPRHFAALGIALVALALVFVGLGAPPASTASP